MYVYKWLLDYCNYNPNSAFNQGIDSVFVRRNSVCTGYAKAAQYLFDLLGIESSLAFGRLNNDKEEGRHCWNIVKIDDKYYHLDICLGDPYLFESIIGTEGKTIIRHEGYGRHFYYKYFCVSTDVIRQSRSIEDLEVLPDCIASLNDDLVSQLAAMDILHRQSIIGCKLTTFGSSADIHLCTYDKHVVLKLFRDYGKCLTEYLYMQRLQHCHGLIQLCNHYTDIYRNIIAIEQATPIVDLLCSHYYKPTFQSIINMIIDIANAWIACKERGILYRDIHICNIYKTSYGRYVLGDFGSCTDNFSKKETVGNQWFMAPETYVKGIFDEQSAIYALTMVLYFVLNDLKPAFCTYGRWGEHDALEKRINGKELPFPSSVSYSYELAEFLRKGAAFSPKRRFYDMRIFIYELGLLSYRIHDVYINHDMYLPNEEIPYSIPIGRDWHHKFAYGNIDHIEQSAATVAYPFSDTSESHRSKIDEVESYCRTMGSSIPCSPTPFTYEPATHSKTSLWDKLFHRTKGQTVHCSVFAPAEVRPKTHLMVQVFLHLPKETEKVKALAQESQKEAERRGYAPLECRLKKGDTVDIQLNIYGETLLKVEKKSLTWQGSYTKRSFDYFIPDDINCDQLSCMVLISINGVLIGEMSFVTDIGEQPRKLNTEVFSHQYKKVFISYSHKDKAEVAMMARGYKAIGIEYFFDRDSLEPGEVFPLKIQEFIDTADLFILCWSKNAAKSDYVDLERKRALKRAFPQVKPLEKAPLHIYPLNIKPRTNLPDDMKDNYHFGEIL